MAYRYERQGRSLRTGISVAAVWLGLAALHLILDAAVWILALPALATLPALWDLWRDPRSGLSLDQTHLRWWTGRAEGEVARGEIAHIRLDTSWDFSMRISAVLHSGRRVRLPYECTPPRPAIEAVLEQEGLPVKRHHFSLR